MFNGDFGSGSDPKCGVPYAILVAMENQIKCGFGERLWKLFHASWLSISCVQGGQMNTMICRRPLLRSIYGLPTLARVYARINGQN